jgi:hypothetical protein
MKRSVAMILFILLAMATTPFAADPWIGTWKLNPDKSKAPGGKLPHPTSTNIIDIKDGKLHLISDQASTTGEKEHVEYTAGFDGKEYPVTSTPQGPQLYTITLKNIDARIREFVEVIGTFTIKGRDILSEDGKTFSRILELKDKKGNDASVIQFFEKQ